MKDDYQVVKSFIGQDSCDITGFSMTSDISCCLNPKVESYCTKSDLKTFISKELNYCELVKSEVSFFIF